MSQRDRSVGHSARLTDGTMAVIGARILEDADHGRQIQGFSAR
jgi:hypothetical protein